MPHFSQTPEGRRQISERMKAYAKTPAGKLAAKRRAKATQKAWAAKRAALNGHAPSAKATRAESGRAMLVALARPEAERKIVRLQREIETLRLFLERTKA